MKEESDVTGLPTNNIFNVHNVGNNGNLLLGTPDETIISNNIHMNGNQFDSTENGIIHNSSAKMHGILEEFTKLYSEKLQRINDMEEPSEEFLKRKISVLESWVEDLGEQNNVLVSTVVELEKEASQRVSLLQERLDKMAVVTRDSCVSLRDHQIQVNSLVKQKVSAEEGAQELRDKVVSLEHLNTRLLQENTNLRGDLDNLVEVIAKVRVTGRWEIEAERFKLILPERLFGSKHLQLRTVSPPISGSSRDFPEMFIEDAKTGKNSSSSRASQQSTEAEEESIQKLKSELRMMKQTHQETNAILTQRDKHIADLQTQLTDLHHQLALAQTQVDNTTSTLHNLRDRGRHDTFEICRRDDVIRKLLSPSRRLQNESNAFTDDYEAVKKTNIELQLSENIDDMAARLADLDEECQQLRHQNTALKATHARCGTTISQLQEQLNNNHLSMEDLRSVLTAEVAERHDQMLSLRTQLHEAKQQNKEVMAQLQLKAEVIKNLRKDHHERGRDKTFITEKEEADCGSIIFSSKNTQTEAAPVVGGHSEGLDDGTKKEDEADLLKFSLQVSKLENELAEKNILLRELQNHLSSSRKELHLKDETLFNVEQKLDSTRRDYNEKEDRMMYLTSQLTNLQLEVSRLHGHSQQLRIQLDNKSQLVHKLESENDSLCSQLNDKSALLEKMQREAVQIDLYIEKYKKEMSEQKLTISTLRDALVATKQTCDKLRKQYDAELEEVEKRNMAVRRVREDTPFYVSSQRFRLSSAPKIIPKNDIYIIPNIRLIPDEYGIRELSSDGQGFGDPLRQRLDYKLLLEDLGDQLQEAKMEVKMLKEKCQMMEAFQESEFSTFVNGLTKTQDHRIRRLQETLCSCDKFLPSEELSENQELKSVVEELTQYLQEAHDLALTVEKERDILAKNLTKEQTQHLQETLKQQESLRRITHENCLLMSQMDNFKKELSDKITSKEFSQQLYEPISLNRQPSSENLLTPNCHQLKNSELTTEELAQTKSCLEDMQNADEQVVNLSQKCNSLEKQALEEKVQQKRNILMKRLQDLQQKLTKAKQTQEKAKVSSNKFLYRLQRLQDEIGYRKRMPASPLSETSNTTGSETRTFVGDREASHSNKNERDLRNQRIWDKDDFPVQFSQPEEELLKARIQALESQLNEETEAKEMLSADADIVVESVRQWLQDQKIANSRIAGKLHEQNKQILILSTEKQRLAAECSNLKRHKCQDNMQDRGHVECLLHGIKPNVREEKSKPYDSCTEDYPTKETSIFPSPSQLLAPSLSSLPSFEGELQSPLNDQLVEHFEKPDPPSRCSSSDDIIDESGDEASSCSSTCGFESSLERLRRRQTRGRSLSYLVENKEARRKSPLLRESSKSIQHSSCLDIPYRSNLDAIETLINKLEISTRSPNEHAYYDRLSSDFVITNRR